MVSLRRCPLPAPLGATLDLRQPLGVEAGRWRMAVEAPGKKGGASLLVVRA